MIVEVEGVIGNDEAGFVAVLIEEKVATLAPDDTGGLHGNGRVFEGGVADEDGAGRIFDEAMIIQMPPRGRVDETKATGLFG